MHINVDLTFCTSMLDETGLVFSDEQELLNSFNGYNLHIALCMYIHVPGDVNCEEICHTV